MEKINIATMVLFVAAALIALILMSNYRESIYKVVYKADGYIVRAIKKMYEEDAQTVDGGMISLGNLYPAGTKHLLVETDRQPKQTLYLRGFKGGNYIRDFWSAADDNALYKIINKKIDWDAQDIPIRFWYDGMYYTLNHMSHQDSSSMSLRIMRLLDGYTSYEPYYSERIPLLFLGGESPRYEYVFFEQADMDVDWEEIPEDSENTWEERSIYEQLQRAYIEEIQVPYTQVPTELLPRLTAFVKENPLEDLNEITAFILYTLHSNATYSLTPGWAPLDRDIAEYFLFDNGYGYCQHFALTATLLYRLYGVPARYATGYMISPDAFELGENEQYQAVVTDESAHAWTEIFLEDYGWTVVDATPSSDGSTITSYPGFDESELKGVLKEKNWDMNVRNQLRLGENSKNIDNDIDFGAIFSNNKDLFLRLGACLACLVPLLPFFLAFRRLWRLRKLRAAGSLKTFADLIKLVHFAGILRRYDGTEQDFAVRFAGEIAAVPEQSAKRMLEIVNKAAYSLTGAEDSEEEFVKGIYRSTAEHTYESVSWRKKLVFKYIKTFC
ncbi:MAG: transglutaminase-like domain-containing protein [Clostridiales bacterium]|nr:transglutaminase-like domain-containing protein [Clostridiales bacterium]